MWILYFVVGGGFKRHAINHWDTSFKGVSSADRKVENSRQTARRTSCNHLRIYYCTTFPSCLKGCCSFLCLRKWGWEGVKVATFYFALSNNPFSITVKKELWRVNDLFPEISAWVTINYWRINRVRESQLERMNCWISPKNEFLIIISSWKEEGDWEREEMLSRSLIRNRLNNYFPFSSEDKTHMWTGR